MYLIEWFGTNFSGLFQAGADFIQVGLSLGEAEPERIQVGVPAIPYSRVITGVLVVVNAWMFSS